MGYRTPLSESTCTQRSVSHLQFVFCDGLLLFVDSGLMKFMLLGGPDEFGMSLRLGIQTSMYILELGGSYGYARDADCSDTSGKNHLDTTVSMIRNRKGVGPA